MSKVVIWYDGGCPFCRHEIAFMRRLDSRRAILFVDVSDEDVECPIDRDVLMARLHAIEDGNMLSGAAAFAAMWRAIPMLRLFGLLAKNAVILKMLERVYVVFLRVRPLFQRIKSPKLVRCH